MAATFPCSVAKEKCEALDLLQSDPAFLPAARRRDAPRKQAVDDRNRRTEERGGVERSGAESPLKGVGGVTDRLVGFGRAPGEPQQAVGVEPLAAELPHQGPQAGARIARIEVGRVLRKRLTPRLAEGDKVGFRDREERPVMGEALPLAQIFHPPQTHDSGAPEQAEKDGLGLIVGMMGGRHRIGADRAGVRDEETVAGVPRQFLQPGRGFRALPDEGRVRDAEAGAKPGDRLRLRTGLGAEAMVDGRSGDGRLFLARRPLGGHQEKRRRIRAARHRDQDAGRARKGTKQIVEGGKGAFSAQQ